MIRVEVTLEDIAKGKVGSQCECPIALALRRIGMREVTVVPAWEIRWRGRSGAYRVSTPVTATTFALRFDRGEHVEPFSFDLPVSE